MKHLLLISFFIVFINGCASSIPAPVESRNAAGNGKTPSSRDWRPDTYTVKKGDTLYSIGLAHGLDYREIAAANNVQEPFTIKVGQQLSLNSLTAKPANNKNTVTPKQTEGDVIITPIDTSDAVAVTTSSSSEKTPAINEPKALREPYSQEAFNRQPAKATAVVTAAPTKAIETPSPQPAVKKKSTWSWPTKGKVIGRFNVGKNKGIDIAGNKGQAITASAAGKVIYAGSDLRGYGKLVIIKHNNTYLSVYAHNSKIIVKEGQKVKAGQKVAAMGDTDTNTVKLHFEIRERGKSVDPAKFLPQN